MNLEAALSRLKAICHVSADQEVAQLFKITPQNFANKKKKGTLYLDIVHHALNHGMNLGEIFHGDAGGDLYNKDRGEDSAKTRELISMTREILESGTEFSGSLAANIKSFHYSLEMERRVDRLEEEVSDLRKKKVDPAQKGPGGVEDSSKKSVVM